MGEPVAADDPDDDLLFYSLVGADARFFRIDDAGQIMVGPGTMLDYETRTAYEVQVIAADGNGNSAAADVTIMVTDVDLGRPTTGTATRSSTGTRPWPRWLTSWPAS